MIEDQNVIDETELFQQKQRIEEKIKRAERKQIDDRIIDSLKKLGDISDSVSDLQYNINVIWKRTKQVEEELKEILSMPSLPSVQQEYPQQQNPSL